MTFDILTFKHAINSVAFAMDTESCRYALANICVENDGDDSTVFVATDGRQMATYRLEGQCFVPERTDRHVRDGQGFQLLLNGKDCKAFVAACGQSARDGSAYVTFDDGVIHEDAIGRIRLKWKQKGKGGTRDCEATVRIMDGRFPKWRDVFPKKRDTYLAGTAKDFVENLPTATQRRNFLFDLNGHVQVTRPALAWSNVKWHGEPLQVGFNFDLLEDWLRTLPGKQQVRIDLGGETNVPALGTCGASRYVLMPVDLSK